MATPEPGRCGRHTDESKCDFGERGDVQCACPADKYGKLYLTTKNYLVFDGGASTDGMCFLAPGTYHFTWNRETSQAHATPSAGLFHYTFSMDEAWFVLMQRLMRNPRPGIPVLLE